MEPQDKKEAEFIAQKLLGRVARLQRLIHLDAPPTIIGNELRMVRGAQEELHRYFKETPRIE